MPEADGRRKCRYANRNQGGWIVGHEKGAQHTSSATACSIYEANKIIHVGHTFAGPVDETLDATDKLLAPGFIDTHVHRAIAPRTA